MTNAAITRNQFLYGTKFVRQIRIPGGGRTSVTKMGQIYDITGKDHILNLDG